jgi:hypothetical protein
MKNLIILTLCAMAIFNTMACHKDPEFASCEGHVLEKGSNKPVANAMIIVQSCTANSDKFNLDCSYIDTIFSDANGKYSYYQDEKELAKYGGSGQFNFLASKKGYINQQFPVFMPNRGAATRDITITPSAWLKLHVKAVNHYEPNDIIEIRGLYAGAPLPGGGFKSINEIVEYSKLYLKSGNDSTTIAWTIRTNGGSKEVDYFKKIYLPALDTTEFKLFF